MEPQPNDISSSIDFRELFRRLAQGYMHTIGLALIGPVLVAILFILTTRSAPTIASTKLVFSFDGFERGQYPDGSKFQPDDLRSADVIREALHRQSVQLSDEYQTVIRGAVTIEGVIPAGIVKERDRLRALGQTPQPYIPDEYDVSLSLSRNFPLNRRQRELLLNEIINVFREKFQRTYVNLPISFGNAFSVLHDSDYIEYELILHEDVQNTSDYLSQLLNQSSESAQRQKTDVRSFRSATTNLSFSDLLKQVRLFTQIELNETLGTIYSKGLTKDRETALLKMDFYIHTLQMQEREALQADAVITDLLNKAQTRSQDYILGIKSEAAQTRPNNAILDQGLINSLLANDSYGLLVKRALDSGLKVKHIQAELTALEERRKRMEAFAEQSPAENAKTMAFMQSKLDKLKSAYDRLVNNIRDTHHDFVQQTYADAVRLSTPIYTESYPRKVVTYAILGFIAGVILGIGLSLIGIYPGAEKQSL